MKALAERIDRYYGYDNVARTKRELIITVLAISVAVLASIVSAVVPI